MAELRFEEGWVEPALREEFRGLRLRWASMAARSGRSPRELKDRLRHLSDRVHGERVLDLRREPVASAHRVFFRQVGIDPDQLRPPAEAAMVERLRAGRFESRGLLEDALTAALVETGVAVRGFDANSLSGPLGLRLSRPGERLGGDGPELADGTIVVADERDAVALVFGETAPGREARKGALRVALCAVQVPGVPDISVEEALWTVAGIVAASVE
jgi:DNA/RNA-binding domain of Phe-tRNA-synthetase-like protein